MNPHEFVRRTGFGKAILFTYNFDALFFERVVYPGLKAGGSSDIVVLADRGYLEANAGRWRDQIRLLGRKYVLAASSTRGLFHPKIMLRFGDKSGLAWIGSGNISSGGWGGNIEVASAWAFGPGHEDTGAWVRALLQQGLRWTESELAKNGMRRILGCGWLPELQTDGSAPVLFSDESTSLASNLSRRWIGRRFDEVRLFTGSTDESGAFLDFCHRNWGVQRALVCLTTTNASFVASQLERLPLAVRIVEALPQRLMHAKFYWFSGPDGDAIVSGSANCSAAAWLRSVADGGNIESVLVFDEIDPTQSPLAQQLAQFESAPLSEVYFPPRQQQEDPERPLHRIAELTLDPAERMLTLTLVPAAPPGSRVYLLLGEHRLELEAAGDGARWFTNDTDELESRGVLASVEVVAGTYTYETPPRWLDNAEALREARGGLSPSAPLSNLANGGTTRERARYLEDLHHVARALLDGTLEDEHANRVTTLQRPRSSAPPPAGPLDPERLLVSVRDARKQQPFASNARCWVSMTGALRALFPPKGSEDTGGESEVATEDTPPDRPPKKPPTPPWSARDRQRLAQELSDFVEELLKRGISRTRTPRQLADQAAFPITIAILGSNHDWLAAGTAQALVGGVVEWLLGRRGGALARLQSQLPAEAAASFAQHVGDGTLWLALLAAIGSVDWDGNALLRARIASRVYGASELLSNASPGRLALLLAQCRETSLPHLALEVVPDLARRYDGLASSLEGILKAQPQSCCNRTMTPGEVLFTLGGFVRVSTDESILDGKVSIEFMEKPGNAKFIVNQTLSVREACDTSPAIREAWHALHDG